MAEGKSHRKKKAGRKADKRKSAEGKKKDGDGDDAAARRQNPKAFIFSSRGKAKIQRARTAEKDQRRMHGETCLDIVGLGIVYSTARAR